MINSLRGDEITRIAERKIDIGVLHKLDCSQQVELTNANISFNAPIPTFTAVVKASIDELFPRFSVNAVPAAWRESNCKQNTIGHICTSHT